MKSEERRARAPAAAAAWEGRCGCKRVPVAKSASGGTMQTLGELLATASPPPAPSRTVSQPSPPRQTFTSPGPISQPHVVATRPRPPHHSRPPRRPQPPLPSAPARPPSAKRAPSSLAAFHSPIFWRDHPALPGGRSRRSPSAPARPPSAKRAPSSLFPSRARRNQKIGFTMIACSRSGPTEMRSTGHSNSSSTRRTNACACAGRSSKLRTSVVGVCQPGSSS